MSLSDETEIRMESADAGEMEFVTLPEGQEAPGAGAGGAEEGEEKVALSKAEYDALLAKTDSTSQLSQSFGKLAERLGNQGPQIQQPANMGYQPPPSDEELEKEMFIPGKTIATLRKILQAEQAPIQGQNMLAQVNTNRRLLELDSGTKELYGKYKADIEKRVRSLPPQYQYQPDIYERVYKEVILEKQNEIVEDRATAIAQKAVEAALAQYGIVPGQKPGTSRPALQQEGGPGGAVKPKAKQVAYLTQADVRDMQDKGLDPNDTDQKKYYYERFKAPKGGR